MGDPLRMEKINAWFILMLVSMREEGQVMNELSVFPALLKGFIAHIFVIRDFRNWVVFKL